MLKGSFVSQVEAGRSTKFRVVGVKQDLLVIHREFLKQSRPTMTASLATLPLNNTAYGTREYWQVRTLTPLREVTVDFYHKPRFRLVHTGSSDMQRESGKDLVCQLFLGTLKLNSI